MLQRWIARYDECGSLIDVVLFVERSVIWDNVGMAGERHANYSAGCLYSKRVRGCHPRWAFRPAIRVFGNGMTQQPTPFANFAMLAQQPIHRADLAMIDALIQQCGVDIRRGLIRETRRMKQVQHHPLLRTGQRTG